MKRTDIDKIFTAYISQLISNGYFIWSESMTGHQGEIAKVLLRKDDDIKIVVMEHSFGNRTNDFIDAILVKVGTYNKKTPNYKSANIWLDDFNYFLTDRFYLIGHEKYKDVRNNWYGTLKEAKAAREKMLDRLYKSQKMTKDKKTKLNDVPTSVKNHVRTIWGFKRVKDSEIEVEINYKRNGGRTYTVFAKERNLYTVG